MSIELGTLPPNVLKKYFKNYNGKVFSLRQICKLGRKRVARYNKIDSLRAKKRTATDR